MTNTLKSLLAGSTVIIATTLALTSMASAQENGKKRSNGTVGIQSVVPKAPAAKIGNNRNQKQRRFVRPKAPIADRGLSRQIAVVPNTNSNPNKIFSVVPKAPPAKEPDRQVVEVAPQIEPEVVGADETIVEEAPKPKLKKKIKPKRKVIKKAPKKAKKKLAKKHKPKRKYHGSYHYNHGDYYYESEPYYETETYYETEPYYDNGYSSGYYSGSSYQSHGYSSGYTYSQGYQCK